MSYVIRESTFENRSLNVVNKTFGEFATYKEAHEEVKRLVLSELAVLNDDQNMTIRDIDNPAYEFRGSMRHKFHTAVLWRFGSSFNLYEDYHPIKFYDIEEVL